jgi:hypothetical protein
VGVLLSKDLPVSAVHRLEIEYRDRSAYAGGGPRSLFLKLCRPLPAEPDGLARSEIEFYRIPATAMSCPPLVRCYDAAFDEESGRSHLLLEDLTETHSQPAENEAPSRNMSRSAVEALAKSHAAWWNSPKLGNGVGTLFDDEWLGKFIEDLEKSVRRFFDAAQLTAKQKAACRVMLDAAPSIWGRLTDPRGLTVTHGDMHWWNFLYPKDRITHSVCLFDWQLWHIDLGARDLAFLLALGGFAEPRPAIEKSLLRAYHDALAVDDYTWEMLLEDYRWSAIRNLNVPVIFWKQGKHRSTWEEAMRRAVDAFERLDCRALL